MVKFTRNSQQVFVGGQQVNSNMVFHLAGSQTMGALALLSNLGGQTITHFYSATGLGLEGASASAQDAAAGTGCTLMRLWGFDAKGYLMYEDIIPTGATDFVTVNLDWQSVFHIEGLTYGGGKQAAGHITVENLANNAYYLAIDATGTSSRKCEIYVPEGVIAAYEFLGWFTNDTTAYDAIQAELYTIAPVTNDTLNLIKNIAKSGVADLETPNPIRMQGLLQSGKINSFRGTDIGTTAQVMNYALTVGFRYL